MQPKNSKNNVSNSNNILYKINSSCEWAKCSKKFEDYSQLQVHVTEHIKSLKSYENENHRYGCPWDLCNYLTTNYQLFSIHIHYHVYHTNLKNKGESLIMGKKLPPCQVDSRQRNFIPEINQEFLCQWYGCTRKYEEIYNYFSHIREHCRFVWSMEMKYKRNIASKREMKCGWAGCTKSFNKLLPYSDHVQTHSQEKLCACPNCGSTFKAYNNLYKHYERQSKSSK